MTRLFHSFRLRLGLIVLTAALVPLIAIGVVTLEMAQRYMAQQTMRNHLAVIDAFSSGMDLYVDNQVDELVSLAEEPNVQSLQEKKLDDELNEFLATQTFFLRLFVYDEQGKLVATASRFDKEGAQLIGQNVKRIETPIQRSVARAFKDAINKQEVIRCADLARQESKGVLFLAPVADFARGDKIVGVLAGEAVFDGTEIQDIVQSYPARGSEYICILNEKGEIEAAKGKGIASADRFVLPQDFLAKESSKASVSSFAVDNNGRSDLLTLSRSKSLGGFIAIGRPAREAFDYLNDLHANFLVIILLAIVMATGGAFYIAWSVSQPISALTEGLIKVRDGVFSHRVEVASEDELGEASQALNMLAETFQKKRVVGSIWEKMRAEVSTSGRD